MLVIAKAKNCLKLATQFKIKQTMFAREVTFRSQFANNMRSSLVSNNRYDYHMYYLMNSKSQQNYIKIDIRSFHLYLDYMRTRKFNKIKFIIVLIDCVRTNQKHEDFIELVNIGLANLDKITDSTSIIALCTQLFLYNYEDKQNAIRIASRTFQILKQEYANGSFVNSFLIIKFLIFIQKVIGVEKFTNQQYSIINFNKFKILYLCFTLQIFYIHNLQHYKVAQDILDMFLNNDTLIPFGDMHHFSFAIKSIKQPKFIQFVNRQKQIMGQSLSKVSINKQSSDSVPLQKINYNWFKTFQIEIQKKYV